MHSLCIQHVAVLTILGTEQLYRHNLVELMNNEKLTDVSCKINDLCSWQYFCITFGRQVSILALK